MDLEAILPIIDEIVKDSLSQKVYIYGRNQTSTTSRVASGRLRDSIKSVIVQNKQGIQVIQMQAFGQPLSNTYAYWLINDRQPGSAPSSAIEKWIREKKSFRIRDFKTGQFLPKNDKNIKSAAYVIARSLKKFGYQNKPKNFWEISVEKIENNPQILELIAEATFDDLYQALEGI
jgi:hypothetical protein